MKHIKKFKEKYNSIKESYKPQYKFGDLVMIADDNDNDNYDDYRGKVLKIDHVARNQKEHRGYDDSMEGMGLYDLIDVETDEYVPFSLYDYELQPA